jgi:hypothetical protein
VHIGAINRSLAIPRSVGLHDGKTPLVIKGMLQQPTFPISARAAALALAGLAWGAHAGEIAVTCTNPFSGASWRIAIDFDRGTVDSNPARIGDTEISWRDANDGWRYTLDRKSGKLTVVLASATGGNFLYDQCKLPN